MLSVQEKRQWQELAGRLADDERRMERAAGRARRRQFVRERLRQWLPLIVLPCIGLILAFAGARENFGIPALGISGFALIIIAPTVQVWYLDYVVVGKKRGPKIHRPDRGR